MMIAGRTRTRVAGIHVDGHSAFLFSLHRPIEGAGMGFSHV